MAAERLLMGAQAASALRPYPKQQLLYVDAELTPRSESHMRLI